MEVNVNGTTYIVNESYEIQDKEKRDNTIVERLAAIIIRDNWGNQDEIENT